MCNSGNYVPISTSSHPTLNLKPLCFILQQGSPSSNPSSAIPGWKSELFLSLCVMAIFVRMERLNFCRLVKEKLRIYILYSIITDSDLIFSSTRKTRIISQRHKLAFLQRITIKRKVSGQVLDPKSSTFPRDGTQFCAVSPGSSVQFEIQQTLGWQIHE